MPWNRSTERVLHARRVLGEGLWGRDALLAHGWAPRQIERDLESGRLVRVAHGVYRAADARPAWDQPATYAPLLDRSDGAVSHESAGLIHGVWWPYPADRRLHLTSSARAVTSDPSVRRHRASLEPADVETLAGVRVTTIPRTAVDLARGAPFTQALVPLDSAVRRMVLGAAAGSPAGRVLLAAPEAPTRIAQALAEVGEAVDRCAGGRGTRGLRRALENTDPRSESPYESWCRGELILAGTPPEVLGLAVHGASGRLYYADFAWPSYGVLGEADGVTKYGNDLRTVRERVIAERHRQRDLEDAGWTFARWTAGEPSAVLTARVARVLAGARARGA